MITLLLLLGCADGLPSGGVLSAEVREPCLDDPSACPSCEADDDCVFMGNPCHETVDCAHQGAGFAYDAIGCSPATERRWPDDDACVCEASSCQSAD